MPDKVLFLESGGSKFVTGAVERGKTDIIAEKKTSIDHESKESLLNDMTQTLKSSLDQSPFSIEEIDSIGVVSAGIWDYKEGVVLPPNLPFQDKEFPIGRKIKQEFEKPVYVENDVNAGVQAEAYFGYGRKNDVRFIGYLTISTGIGLGLWDSKHEELISGEMGKAPEIGHNIIVPGGIKCGCGGKGHWEAYGSGEGVCRLAKKLSDDPKYETNTKELMKRAREGDEFAEKVIRKAAYYNAIGFGQIINSYQPGAVRGGDKYRLQRKDLEKMLEEN